MEYTFTFTFDEMDILWEAINAYHMKQHRILKEVKDISADAAKQTEEYIKEIEELNNKLHKIDEEE